MFTATVNSTTWVGKYLIEKKSTNRTLTFYSNLTFTFSYYEGIRINNYVTFYSKEIV